MRRDTGGIRGKEGRHGEKQREGKRGRSPGTFCASEQCYLWSALTRLAVTELFSGSEGMSPIFPFFPIHVIEIPDIQQYEERKDVFHVSGVRSRETRNLFSTFEGLTMIRSTGIPVG